MEFLELINKLNIENSFFYKNQLSVQFFHSFSILLLNLVSYLYIFVKFYKVLCYSKMTFEWLPMINPYIWPFSIFQVLTGPYFKFWSKIFPSIRFETTSLEISGVVALESLNSLIYFCVRTTNYLIEYLEELEKTLNISSGIEN
jgi:hypothetical protein